MPLVKLLPWDSHFFGFNIGRIIIREKALSVKSLRLALREGKAKGLRCLYFEMPFDQTSMLHFCSQNNFVIVDFKTTLKRNILEESEAFKCDNITSTIDKPHFPFLVEIADIISRKSRYACDKKFGLKESRRFYREWLQKSFYENYCDRFFVNWKNDHPVGFITLRTKNNDLSIDLLGVSELEQASGIGTALIKTAEKFAYSQGYKGLSVVTQGHNVAALRAYQKMNFKVENVNVFYHIWLD